MVNYKLKALILEVVDNQINMNDPKCTKETLNRLMDLGYSKDAAKEKIAAVLVEEMNDIMKNEVVFDEKKFAEKLSLLPGYLDKYVEDDEEETIKQMPLINEHKVGRNDPCPCGSGKKYKKCCGK